MLTTDVTCYLHRIELLIDQIMVKGKRLVARYQLQSSKDFGLGYIKAANVCNMKWSPIIYFSRSNIVFMLRVLN